MQIMRFYRRKSIGIALARLKKLLYLQSQIYAEIAQLVEHNLAKVRVASSSLVFRSKAARQQAANRIKALIYH